MHQASTRRFTTTTTAVAVVVGLCALVPTGSASADSSTAAAEVAIYSAESIARALDANGTPVPTSYDIVDGQLTQTVNHTRNNYVYPVIADPCWTCRIKKAAKITYCAASITLAIVSVASFAGWVKKIGGAKKAASILVGSGSVKKKILAVAGSVTGLGAVVDACS